MTITSNFGSWSSRSASSRSLSIMSSISRRASSCRSPEHFLFYISTEHLSNPLNHLRLPVEHIYATSLVSTVIQGSLNLWPLCDTLNTFLCVLMWSQCPISLFNDRKQKFQEAHPIKMEWIKMDKWQQTVASMQPREAYLLLNWQTA